MYIYLYSSEQPVADKEDWGWGWGSRLTARRDLFWKVVMSMCFQAIVRANRAQDDAQEGLTTNPYPYTPHINLIYIYIYTYM